MGASADELELHRTRYLAPALNPWVMEFATRAMAGTLPPVLVCRTEELVPVQRFRQTEIYERLFRPHGD